LPARSAFLGAGLVIGARKQTAVLADDLLLEGHRHFFFAPGAAQPRHGMGLIAGSEKRAGERDHAFAGNGLLIAEIGKHVLRIALLGQEQVFRAAADQGHARPGGMAADEVLRAVEADVFRRVADRKPRHEVARGGVGDAPGQRNCVFEVAVLEEGEGLLHRSHIARRLRLRSGCDECGGNQ
jgi:hypothetical protein